MCDGLRAFMFKLYVLCGSLPQGAYTGGHITLEAANDGLLLLT